MAEADTSGFNLNLSLSLSGVRSAVSVDVFAHFNVGHLPSLHRDGDVAQRTYWDLDILQKKQKNIRPCLMLTGVPISLLSYLFVG